MNEEHFAFTIDTGLDGTFAIPTSQVYPYDWLIDWGDGTAMQTASGVGNSTSAGIPHAYANPGIYKITIRPNDTITAWFRAFGFYNSGTGANATTNKEKLIAVNATLTTAMFAEPDATVLGDNVALNMFYGCRNLASLPANFNLPQNITEVGNSFAYYMFCDCRNLTSLPTNFNLPQGITEVGNCFAVYMFRNCTNLTSLPANFNLPPDITTVGNYFAQCMFSGCSSLTSLPANFNLPQDITTVGDSFARNMFCDCTNLTSLPANFNLPPNITTVGTGFAGSMYYGCSKLVFNSVFKFPQGLTQIQVDKTTVFFNTIQSCTASQSRTAASIIGTLPTPSTAKNTFTGSGFSDALTIPANWR
jgi:hypothetical protein